MLPATRSEGSRKVLASRIPKIVHMLVSADTLHVNTDLKKGFDGGGCLEKLFAQFFGNDSSQGIPGGMKQRVP